MSSRGGDFPDPLEDLLREASRLSDGDVERLLSRGPAGEERSERSAPLEPGARVEATVVEVRGDEVLLELSGKAYGVVDLSEFGDERPSAGERIRATFESYDAGRDLALLSVRGVRRDLAWENLRPGSLVEGIVTGHNKGGLTLDLKGIAAFMPISQVELGGVQDLSPYVGRRLRCEVTSLDVVRKTAIVSRKAVQEAEAQVSRERVFATLLEGQVLQGTVVRIAEHGAFVDIGGFVGLLPAGALQRARGPGGDEPVRVGQRLEVQIARLDRERMRVSLQVRSLAGDSWSRAAEHYRPGDRVTGWVSGLTDEGLLLSIEEGVVGLLPRSGLADLPETPRPGALLKAAVVSVDAERRRLILAAEKGT